MRPLFPLVCFFTPAWVFTQTPQDTTFLQTATRTDNWLSFSSSWDPIDSTSIRYGDNLTRDTVLDWSYDGENWYLKSLTNNSFLPDGREERILTSEFDPFGDLVQLKRTIFDYNQQGQLQLVMNQEDMEGDWTTILRVTYIYDDNRIAAINREQNLQDGSPSLNRTEFKYDDRGNILEEVNQSLVSDSLVNDYRIIQTYTDDNLVQERLEEEWSFNNWISRSRIEYSNLRTPQMEIDTAVSFQFLGGDWRRFFRTIDTRDLLEERNSTYLLQQSLGGNWVDLQRNVYVYDPETRIQTITAQQNIGFWRDLNRTVYIFDQRDLKREKINQNPTENGWENSTRKVYFYSSFTNPITSVKAYPLANVSVFPNPTTNFIIMDIGDQPSTFMVFRLYDSQGRLWLQQNVMGSALRIDLPDHLPVGNYYVHLRSEKGSGSWPIIRVSPW